MQSAFYWRIERKGYGPYWGENFEVLQPVSKLEYDDGGDDSMKRWPTPAWDDTPEGLKLIDALEEAQIWPENARFGFTSIEQARQWWYCPDDLKVWDKYDTHLVAIPKYETARAVEACHQAVWIGGATERVEFPASALWTKEPEELEREAKERLH
jgi:hypothetical protein